MLPTELSATAGPRFKRHKRAMRTLAVANQKGGTAKTTTAVNLAAVFAERGCRCLLVDLDPQGAASSWLGADQASDLLAGLSGPGTIAALIRPTTVESLEVLPASPSLVGAERVLAGEVGAETLLRRALAPFGARWRFVLVDTPPTLGILTINALVAAREVLVPVDCHALALAGLVRLLDMIEAVRSRLNPGLHLAGILACRLDGRTRQAAGVLAELRMRLGRQVFAAVIRENVKLAEAATFKKSILSYAPSSTAAEDYRALAREILGYDKGRMDQ